MKIKLFVKYISLLVLLFVVDGCKEKKADTYVTKVTDLTGEEEQVLKLEYDRDGKIIKYGDTPVRYEGDEVFPYFCDVRFSGGNVLPGSFALYGGT